MADNVSFEPMCSQFSKPDLTRFSARIGNDYGYSVINPRHKEAFFGEMNVAYNNFEANDIGKSDRATLEPMAESLNEFRCWGTGKRMFDKDRVPQLLNNDSPAGAHKSLALYKLYCAKYGGLKDENGPLDFKNLKDPALLINQSQDFVAISAAGKHNATIDRLTDIALKSHSHELAAVLIKESGKGAGVDNKIIEKLLIDSKEQLGENGYNRFISDTANSYKELTGEPLDKFIKTEYSKDPFGLGWFGADKEGKDYLNRLDNARQNTHGISDYMGTSIF